MTLTGAATIFGSYIVSFGRESIFLCLVLMMITCIILGTGLPTIPTYIITASLAAPALLKLGVPLIVSHMFVFYYGIIADLTPPVALAALAAAPIAKASPDAIGWQATRIALAGFLIPFMAVYEPAADAPERRPIAAQFGYWVEVAWVLVQGAVRHRHVRRRGDRLPQDRHDTAGTGAGRRIGLPCHRGFQLQRPYRDRRGLRRHRAEPLPSSPP